MYDLCGLHGQFLISFLKAYNDVSFINSVGIIFQIFGPSNKMLSVLKKTFLTLGKSNCENCCKL